MTASTAETAAISQLAEGMRVWPGGVRLLGSVLAVVPGRTTDDPAVLRQHAAACLAAAACMDGTDQSGSGALQ